MQGARKLRFLVSFLRRGARFGPKKRYWSLNFCAGGTKIKVVFKFFKKRGTILTKNILVGGTFIKKRGHDFVKLD